MADSIGKGFPTTNIHRGHIFCDLDDLTYWKYIGGDPRLVSSWVLINGIFQTQPDTSQWGINQAGAMWFYAPEQTYYGWDGEALCAIAFVGGENLYRYQNTIMLQDDFYYGGNASGIVGSLGWSFNGGTITGQGSETNAPGIFRLDTSAVSGTVSRLLFNQSTAIFLTFPQDLLAICRLNNNDANTTARIGYLNLTSASPPDNGVYFEKLDADTTWFCVTRDGAAGPARVDTGVAVNTGFNTFRIVRTTTGVDFYLNNVFITTMTASIPSSTSVSPCFQIVNSAAAAKTLDVDYFQLMMTGLAR